MQCVSLQIDVFINKPVSHIICIWFVTSSDAVCMRLIQLIPIRPQTNFSMQTCNACSTLCCCENGAKYAMLVSDADQLLIVFQIMWESSLYLKCIIISYQYCSSYINCIIIKSKYLLSNTKNIKTNYLCKTESDLLHLKWSSSLVKYITSLHIFSFLRLTCAIHPDRL